MTNWIKIVIAAAIAGLIGYSYLWTFNQGKAVGTSKCVSAQVQALKESLIEQEKQFRDQREAEMREAAKTSKKLIENERKKVKDLQDANKLLREKGQAWANVELSPDYNELLNRSRGDKSSPEST